MEGWDLDSDPIINTNGTENRKSGSPFAVGALLVNEILFIIEYKMVQEQWHNIFQDYKSINLKEITLLWVQIFSRSWFFYFV